MSKTVFMGKHAELCRAISAGHRDDAMKQIYAFFRSEDNTDSYSISLLTIVRELLEEGDSDEMYRLRIRMRSSGDRVLINLAQFVLAFEEGGEDEISETLAGKCLSELPKLSRSMQEVADEDGVSDSMRLAGRRIREAVRMLAGHFERQGTLDAYDRCLETGLEMTRIFLYDQANFVSEDLMRLARSSERRGNTAKRNKLCREIVREYAGALERLEGGTSFSREDYETLEALSYAYNVLEGVESPEEYHVALSRIQKILSPDKD